MRYNGSLTLLASLLAGSMFLAAPATAQEWHGTARAGTPPGAPGGAPSGGPVFHPSPIHGAAPGHVYAAPHGSLGPGTGFRPGTGVRPTMGVHPTTGFRGGVSSHPMIFQHHDFAHFTTTERAEWQHGWWHHGQWHGRWGWWWFAGGYWWWYDQPVYPWPTFVSETYYVEPTYDEGDYGYWYYCYDPPGDYPYVQYCNGPWQPVPPTPPAGAGPDDQGPYDEQGPPPGYQDNQGPPPGYQDNQGPPPPNSGQGPGYDQEQGPPPNGQ